MSHRVRGARQSSTSAMANFYPTARCLHKTRISYMCMRDRQRLLAPTYCLLSHVSCSHTLPYPYRPSSLDANLLHIQLSFSLTHTHIHSLAHTHTRTHVRAYAHTQFTHTPTHPLTHTLACFLSPSLPLSFLTPLIPTHAHTHTHTHTHTHSMPTLSQRHTRTCQSASRAHV